MNLSNAGEITRQLKCDHELADAAREAWIKRFQGYFGDPLRLDEYRAGTITFRELYDSANRHAEDMTIEAARCDYAALKDEE